MSQRWNWEQKMRGDGQPVHGAYEVFLDVDALYDPELHWIADTDKEANAHLIAAAPEMAEMLLAEFRKQNCVCRLNPLVGAPVPCDTCVNEALLKKAGVL